MIREYTIICLGLRAPAIVPVGLKVWSIIRPNSFLNIPNIKGMTVNEGKSQKKRKTPEKAFSMLLMNDPFFINSKVMCPTKIIGTTKRKKSFNLNQVLFKTFRRLGQRNVGTSMIKPGAELFKNLVDIRPTRIRMSIFIA